MALHAELRLTSPEASFDVEQALAHELAALTDQPASCRSSRSLWSVGLGLCGGVAADNPGEQ
jgi:hypothetical protein